MTRIDKEFDNILNECLERLLVKGETPEQCLASHPELADDLKPLLQTAAATSKAINIKPSAGFRARAGCQFLSALQEAQAMKSRPFSIWRSRWATAVATVLILLSASGGMVAAAGNSMPDNPLYPLKLAVEQLRLNLTSSPLDKARLYAQLSDKRVAEIIRMAQEGKTDLAEAVTQRLDNELKILASLAMTITGKEDSKMIGAAASMPITPPPAATTTAATAPAPAPTIEDRKGQKPPQTEGYEDGLGGLLEQHAASNQEALGKALETAPEEVKSVLQQAIEVSQAGYEQAINALSQ